MDMHQAFLQELEMEMVNTRKTLERVPEKMDWTPHPKSMTMGRLAQHLAEIPPGLPRRLKWTNSTWRQ
jgi:hypothetical protein